MQSASLTLTSECDIFKYFGQLDDDDSKREITENSLAVTCFFFTAVVAYGQEAVVSIARDQ